MPPISRIDAAPAELRRELEELASKHGFGNISELTDWWNANAPDEHQASRSGVGRYVNSLKKRLEGFRNSADLMRQVKLSFGLDNWVELQSEFLQTTSSMLQQELTELILDDKIKTEDIPLDRLMNAYGRFAQAVSAETDRSYKRLMAEREQERAKLQELKADPNLDAETLKRVLEEIYGLAA